MSPTLRGPRPSGDGTGSVTGDADGHAAGGGPGAADGHRTGDGRDRDATRAGDGSHA
ncbi:hypothetical protein [Streptomyces sp. NPDC053541]|uniref:hypothetical protein n=1 Tax=Streptomyces sp. NPDC053541 TaxID=3365709 RepID=UPI0037D6963F